MYFEAYKQGNLITRGRTALDTISFEYELMQVPSVDLVLPIDYHEFFDGREEVKIFINDKCFWGIVWDITIDKKEETITLKLRHVISEWEYRQISVNHAMSNKDLNIVYKGDETKKNKKNDETITASDFSILAKNLKKMTLKKWVEKARAVAWVTSNGDKVAITSVDSSDVKKDEDTYHVTFSTAKGTSVTVDCTVTGTIEYKSPKTHSDKTRGETIQATPFSVNPDVGLTANDVKQKVKAKAWVYRHKSQHVAVTSITTNFVNEEGEYTVTASTAAGTSITVKVTVEDGNNYSNVNDPSVVDKLEDIYSDMNFAYPGWEIDMEDDAKTEMIDYVYSRQNKLEALTQTMELTEDLFWRIRPENLKRVEIGKFGEKKPYILSTKPSGKTNIRIIEEPTIDYDFDKVINVATVYSDKSDSGMSSLTLREVYMDKELLARGEIEELIQKDGFPVVILHANVNNERDYTRYISQYPMLAPNNELEYAVIDEESIALESGTVIEGTYSFNDISPFEVDGKTIKDDKRIKAATTVYHRVIRKLKQARRSYDITVVTEEIPNDLYVGDRVRLLYDNSIWNVDACSSYWKKLLSYDDWFYITRIEYVIDEVGVETNSITLAKWVKIERETQND